LAVIAIKKTIKLRARSIPAFGRAQSIKRGIIMSFARKMVLASAGMLLSVAAFAADVSGNWNLTVESPRGTQNPTMALTQNGEEVSGTYKGMRGEMPVKGTLKGNDLKLSYTVSMQGNEMAINYEGVVNGDNIEGKVVMGQMGEAKFTATRAK
jgi:hypothetical protein